MHETADTSSISRLGRYEILGRIATGGMATVYLARLDAAGGFTREFAIKVIHPHLAEEPDFHARFMEEARLASRVRHPHAVRTVDAGEDHGYRYLVLELIDGVNLRQLLVHRDRPLSPVQAAAVMVHVARGLSALHQATDERGCPLNMVHRDLSPHNVMIDREGRAILIDLGLAKAEARELTQVGVMIGKLPYMSPEQARLEPLDASSDLFSMGTMLFELCTGELPFGETHTTATYEGLQTCDPTRLAQALERHHVPRWLIDVILVCLRPDKRERFASANELVEALTQELQRQGYDESRIRSSLASLVAEAMPEIGTTEALDRRALPPALLQPARRQPPIWSGLRWAAAGAGTVALLGSLVLGIQWRGGDPPTLLERAPRKMMTTLANDEAAARQRMASPVSEARRWTKSDGDAGESPEDPTEAAATGGLHSAARDLPPPPPGSLAPADPLDPDLAAHRSRRARGSRRALVRLKPNPYAQP